MLAFYLACLLLLGGQGNHSYTVFPLPVENPEAGERVILNDPIDPLASPMGWLLGTQTSGPNAIAGSDRDGDGTPGLIDGGSSLSFDFPLDLNQPPSANRNAIGANLFYWVNLLHDVFYHFGFTETDGNFQGDDPVIAVFQTGADHGVFNQPGSVVATIDGTSPILRLYEWHWLHANRLTVTPAPNTFYRGYASDAAYGPLLDATGVVAGLALVQDAGADTHLGCGTIANNLSGAIAMVDRGDCGFVTKTRYLQNAGALAVVIVNDVPGEEPFELPGSDPGITIPTVMISYEDGQALKTVLEQDAVTANLIDADHLVARDAALDSGEIVSLYVQAMAHRLVGGPNRIDCMDHAENPIFGFANFFALSLTQDHAKAQSPRGLGAWTRGLPDGHAGRLHQRYQPFGSFQYGDLYDGMPLEEIGSVWGAVLWTFRHLLVEEYGFSRDLSDPMAGNVVAIKLAIECMKNLPCDPTFIDTRHSLVAAATALEGGETLCLAWQALAAHGLGESASHGADRNTFNDNVANHDLPANLCNPEPYLLEGDLATWGLPVPACVCDLNGNDIIDLSELMLRFNETPIVHVTNQEIPENSPINTELGRLSAVPPAPGSSPRNDTTFTITSQNPDGAFRILSVNNQVSLAVNNPALFDYETHPHFGVTIECELNDLTIQRTFMVEVTNVNEPPSLITPILSPPEQIQNSPITPFSIAEHFSDPENASLAFTWSGLPNGTGLTLSEAGMVGGTPTLADVNASPVTIAVTASDGTYTANGNFTITISSDSSNQAPVLIGPIPDQTYAVGDTLLSYQLSDHFDDPDGNDNDLIFSLDGLLPEWELNFGQGGTLNGTPQAAGTALLTVTARDLDGLSASGTFTLSIVQGYVVTLTASPPGTGTFSRPNSPYHVLPGSDFSVAAIPVSGYRFLRWTINGQVEICSFPPCNPILVPDLQEDKDIVAVFERIR